MNFGKKIALVLFAATVCWPAMAADIGGVPIESEVTVAGVQLVLNGAGVRTRGAAKVNVTQMHALKNFSSLDAMINLPGPKRVTITLLGDVQGGMMGKSLGRGIEDNYPKASISKLIPSLIRMTDVFTTHKSLSAGDRVVIEWVPGTGTVLSVKGKVQGAAFKEPEFFRALMSIWLGPVPVDAKLKDALLGQK
jgi:hypothetical protein